MSHTHTPGPWPWHHEDKRIIVGPGLVEGPWGYDLAEVYADDCPHEVAEANARLIAAAPELLEACSGWLEYLSADEPGDGAREEHLLDAMRAAIAKATGQ